MRLTPSVLLGPFLNVSNPLAALPVIVLKSSPNLVGFNGFSPTFQALQVETLAQFGASAKGGFPFVDGSNWNRWPSPVMQIRSRSRRPLARLVLVALASVLALSSCAPIIRCVPDSVFLGCEKK